ncbi:hypothetical protein B0T17DRAFT_613111 [Bombardia bombarda]|uniref:FAD-binding domain-containing protein n=1 Tax=Bombardia bombarda TaxID=252184 RepID=A0AA39XMH7_9PEZI|nr:hypothetical protein B0T17DRAFT_613111 [Bombardia bombarda]
MKNCDVLIVGAGPVGTTLALELALHHVSFRIIDKIRARSDESRAVFMQPRVLELLNHHGDAHVLESRGSPYREQVFFINKKEAGKLTYADFGPVDTTFPLPLILSQAETERFLDECLAKYGAAIERPFMAKTIAQDDDGVTTILEAPDGRKETIRSKYVVGCDGAHSVVREAANIEFEGTTYPQDFILCDTHEFLNKFELGDSGTLYDPTWLARFRLHHRGASRYRNGRLFVAGDAAHIHSPAGGQGMNTGIQDSVNLGWKLAWALRGTAAAASVDKEALLDSYHAERHPVAQKVLKGTYRLFSFASSGNWLVRQIRNFIVPFALPKLTASESRRRRIFELMSQIAIGYRGSPIVGRASGRLRETVQSGDRLPDGKLERKQCGRITAAGETRRIAVQRLCSGTTYHLLLFSGTNDGNPATAETLEDARDELLHVLKNEIQVHIVVAGGHDGVGSVSSSYYADLEDRVHAQYGFANPGYVLVRPDLYIVHIGLLEDFGELLDFLR